jgi:predicted alpha/beta-fold hydrolase
MKFTIASLLLSLCLVSCAPGGSGSSSVKRISEVTAFNPQTGQPLKVEDLTAALFSNDMDGDGGIVIESDNPSNDVEETGEVLKRAKTSLLLGWTPTGEYNADLAPECHYEHLSRIIQNENGQTSDLANDIQGWQQQCEAQLSRTHTNNIGILLQFDNVNYDLVQNNIKKLKFDFDDGRAMKGLMALKPGKRPLVIFQTGVFNDAEDGGVVRNYFMNLYDETPFSVLVLGSNTGAEYVKDNHILTMGGFDEGREIAKIAEMLAADPKYKDQIEDIHVVGVSLGSNGALFSSLYNSYSPESPSKIKSVMAFCPVVNLKPTMESVFKYTPRGIFYGILTSQMLHDVYDYVPGLKDYLSQSLFWTNEEMFNATSNMATNYYHKRTTDIPWDMQPFQNNVIGNMDDMWAHNNFIDYVDQVSTPTLVVYAKDDPLVKPSLNSIDLYNHTHNENSNVGVLAFDNGSHCAFNMGESWPTMSALMRTFILKHSSYQAVNMSDVTTYLNTQHHSLSSSQRITKYVLKATKNRSTLEVSVAVFDGNEIVDGRACRYSEAYNGPAACYRNYSSNVDISDFALANIKVPQNEFEAQRLTRWLNTHASLVDADQDLILGNNIWPTQIRFHGQFDL